MKNTQLQILLQIQPTVSPKEQRECVFLPKVKRAPLGNKYGVEFVAYSIYHKIFHIARGLFWKIMETFVENRIFQ